MRTLRCLTWNVEFASPASKRGEYIRDLVSQLEVDVVCLTEATLGMRPMGGHLIQSDENYGYSHNGRRRKVLLWSREPWRQVDPIGSDVMPPGRFIAGTTYGIRFVGVCIPWKDAHVRTGRKDRRTWEDHLAYLEGLRAIMRDLRHEGAGLCVTGDFNQRLPPSRVPRRVSESLAQVLEPDLHVATAGLIDDEGKALIDHVATAGLGSDVVQIIPRTTPDGLRLSDHVGVVFRLMNRVASSEGVTPRQTP